MEYSHHYPENILCNLHAHQSSSISRKKPQKKYFFVKGSSGVEITKQGKKRLYPQLFENMRNNNDYYEYLVVGFDN